MKFPIKYKNIPTSSYRLKEYELVPIRYEDRIAIMQWRNAQIFHLRQKQPLTIEQQDKYFSTVVADLFVQDKPNQFLFSYLKNGRCIGYGGLVHIDWHSFNAEISFIMDPQLETTEFNLHWVNYLSLLYRYAFEDLQLHKIYTYAFDVRPHLYQALELAGLSYEARLTEHYFFNNQFVDVVIHSKNTQEIYLRLADESDANITYQWATDTAIRKYSFHQEPIVYEEHCAWFSNKLKESTCIYFIIQSGNIAVGSIRVDFMDGNGIISYLVDTKFQGRKFSLKALTLMMNILKLNKNQVNLIGYVKKENIASRKIFEKLGFEIKENQQHLIYTKEL